MTQMQRPASSLSRLGGKVAFSSRGKRCLSARIHSRNRGRSRPSSAAAHRFAKDSSATLTKILNQSVNRFENPVVNNVSSQKMCIPLKVCIPHAEEFCLSFSCFIYVPAFTVAGRAAPSLER